MIAEFKKGLSFAEGERWIQRYFLSHPEEFKERVITFESRLELGKTTRIVDVVVDASSTRPCYYEFKSVTNIPPHDFAQQFLKDLEIANDLSQIKWYFDGRKISTLNKELFLEELEKVEIDDKLISKWTSNLQESTKKSFLEFIDDNFNIIFQIK